MQCADVIIQVDEENVYALPKSGLLIVCMSLEIFSDFCAPIQAHKKKINVVRQPWVIGKLMDVNGFVITLWHLDE